MNWLAANWMEPPKSLSVMLMVIVRWPVPSAIPVALLNSSLTVRWPSTVLSLRRLTVTVWVATPGPNVRVFCIGR